MQNTVVYNFAVVTFTLSYFPLVYSIWKNTSNIDVNCIFLQFLAVSLFFLDGLVTENIFLYTTSIIIWLCIVISMGIMYRRRTCFHNSYSNELN